MSSVTLHLVAQMKRRFIRERQRDGINRARGEGAYGGGSGGSIATASGRCMPRGEGAGPAAIARHVGCSRMQVYRVLQGAVGRGGELNLLRRQVNGKKKRSDASDKFAAISCCSATIKMRSASPVITSSAMIVDARL